MKGFIEHMLEQSHEKGTYVSVKLSEESSDLLFDWVETNKILNPVPKNEYHCTIVYSRKGIPEAKKETIKLPINAKIAGWELFNTQGGDKCLVARLDSPELTKAFNTYHTKYDATYDYDEYKPHVTVCYKHVGSAPNTKPDFELSFDKLEFKGLDPDWKAT